MATRPASRKSTMPAPVRLQVWHIRHAKTLRIHAGLSQVELAVEARVGRDAVRRVEHGEPVSERIAVMIFKVLNKHNGGKPSEKKHVYEKKAARKKSNGRK